MAKILFSDKASTTMSGSLASGLGTLNVAPGGGARFPSPTGGDFFYATLYQKDGGGAEINIEVVKITAKPSADSFTISQRDVTNITGYGGGYAYPGTAGTVYVELRWLEKAAAAMMQSADMDAANITNTPAGGVAATTVQAAINELDTEKAPLASPAFTGTPTAPTAGAGTNTTQVATTAFVAGAVATHTGATSAHGVSGNIVGTTGPQTLQNKTLDGTNSLSGNLSLTGTGARITGDFSNATTVANRVMFQTSTVGGNTIVGAIPNGAGNTASFNAYNASDPTNASFAQISLQGADARFSSGIHGSGTYFPMTFYTSGLERMRVSTGGMLAVGRTGGFTGAETASVNGYATFGNDAAPQVILGNTGSSTGVVGTYSNHPVEIRSNNVERMRIDASGNVGIGLVSGGSKLNVLGNVEFRGPQNGTATSVVAFLKGADGTQAGYWGFGSTSSCLEYVNSRGTGHAWYDGGLERMRIGSAGQLGIGGANYGTVGQVLTSNGPSSAPSWASLGTFTTSASAAYTPAVGETLSRAHGLGFTPSSCQLVLECVVADFGYSVGDKAIPMGIWNGTNQFPLALYADGTNCGVKCPTGFLVFIFNKTNGNAQTPTANAWKYYFTGVR